MTEDLHNNDIRFSTLNLTDGKLVESNIRTLKQSDLLACPFAIMMPDHYRDDGTCKCDDPEEQYKMYHSWEYRKRDFTSNGVKYLLGDRGKRLDITSA